MNKYGLTYSKIKKEYGYKFGTGSVLVDFYACQLSPFLTLIALKLGLIPNAVTICMIISGICGALIFWVPNNITRIIGVVLIHMWYILDCSDGEVARITKRFSVHGEELDYMAHTITHPLFMLSFLTAMIFDEVFDFYKVICFVLIIAADSVIRMIYTFAYVEEIRTKEKNNKRGEKIEISLKNSLEFIANIFAQTPNFALIYPIVYVINAEAGAIYLYINCFIASLYAAYSSFSWIKRIHKK